MTDPKPPPGRNLRLAGVSKQFGSFVAVDDLTLEVPRGSFFALLGPSGCGKTTTLRMVAGLERPSSGSIYLGDDDVTFSKPYQRPVNTVFQNYALFPHLDVYENVAFGLRRRRAKDVRRQVTEVLELVELGALTRRRPAQLSGGQQQRVALARAVVNRPDVLLLDEPLGALDLKLRRQMQLELKRIQTEVGLTFVHVTHDQEEAMTMADTIAVMNSGRIEQLGSPVELYESPATAYVANFLGQSNLVRAAVRERSADRVCFEVGGQLLTMPAARCRSTSDEILAGVRPEKIHLVRAGGDEPAGPAGPGNRLGGGIVTDASFTGVSTQYLVRLPFDQELMVFAQNRGVGDVLPVGERVTLSWEPVHTFGLDGAQDAGAGAEVDDDEPIAVG
ncbi:MAG: spermidine/putrescine transport system ATP-binding protein [Mycobacteriales bacterium]|jgi:spermidine/putrescine transport system ATP-binding protein